MHLSDLTDLTAEDEPLGRAVEQVVDLIVAKHVTEPLPRVRTQLVGRLSTAIAEAERSYLTELGDAPQLLPDEEGAPIVLKLWTCPICGERPETVAIVPPRCYAHAEDPATETLLDGVAMEATDYKPRKLPDGFAHLQSSLPNGVDKRFLTRLQRDLERSGEATVALPEVGAHEQNARAVLRYVAGKAGWHPERQGRVSVDGDGAEAMVRWVYTP